jgi:ATP-dependent Zn protease
MEKDERFSHFRSRVMGSLIMTLGAMAAEHVFYGENSQGVSGDVASATATAAAMVGIWAMGPDPVHIAGSLEPDEDVEAVLKRLERIGSMIMNRAGSPGMLGDNPVGAVLSNPDKKRAAAQILGQAYVTAYALMATNRDGLERIAETLVEHKELYGDEVGRLLESVGLRRPEIDLMNPATWPAV